MGYIFWKSMHGKVFLGLKYNGIYFLKINAWKSVLGPKIQWDIFSENHCFEKYFGVCPQMGNIFSEIFCMGKYFCASLGHFEAPKCNMIYLKIHCIEMYLYIAYHIAPLRQRILLRHQMKQVIGTSKLPKSWGHCTEKYCVCM